MASPDFSIHVKIEGLNELRKRLNDDHTLRHELRRVLDRSAIEIEREAKEFAPHPPGLKGYSRGALRESIHVARPSEFQRRIGPSVDYGAFVEWGTGKRGAESGVTPAEGYIYGGDWPGMEAQPYMEPAIKAAFPKMKHHLERLGLNIAKRWTKG